MRILAGLAFLAAAAGAPAQMMNMMQPSYEGLWWNSPAGSESGWGVNITHQGNILFATWFTYDTDGSGLWLVVPRADLMSMPGYMMGYGGYGGETYDAYTYTGLVYRTTGPAFDSASFDPAAVHATEVGTATFRFNDPDAGTFSYSVNGVTGSKMIVRQVYSTVPTCALGGSAGSSTNYQDLWWRGPSESGWGINLTHQGDTIFATWFTYDSSGRGLWLVMSNGVKTAEGVYSGPLYRTTGPAFNAASWSATPVNVTAVGSATLTFSDANNGMFSYTVNGVSQSKPITRQVFSSPMTICR